MMRYLWLATLSVVAIFGPELGHAQSIFGGSNKLDPSFCREGNIRQTVVYIDESILVSGDTNWALRVYNKLVATLAPGERTTLVELSTTTGESNEVWTGCWPAYTPDQTAKLASQRYIFSTSPLAVLKTQQSFFARDFGIAAEKIQEKGARSASSVAIDPSDPPQKSIIRALASDGARYAHTSETIRAILYSDLAENSDLGSVFKAIPDPPTDYGAKLGAYLRRSVFYAFGAAGDIKGDGSIQDTIHVFWDEAFRSMAANIGGIGTDLNVPNEVPIEARAYDLALRDDGQILVGRLSILADSDGTMVDSWLGITRLRTAAINGSFHCDGTPNVSSCTLDATTSGGVVTTSPAETVSLVGRDGSSLTGTIGVQGSNVNLPLTATPTTD